MTTRGQLLERIMLMPDHRKNRLLIRILDAMFSDENGAWDTQVQWDSDTPQHVYEVLCAYDLNPHAVEETACQVASSRQQSST